MALRLFKHNRESISCGNPDDGAVWQGPCCSPDRHRKELHCVQADRGQLGKGRDLALLKLCQDAKLMGLTATNVRYLDNNHDIAKKFFSGHIAIDMTLGEAVVRGILSTPKYVTTVYQCQKTLAKYQADGLDRVFAHHITNKSGKYIVFCANKEHMDEMVSYVPEWFAGVNPDVVVYQAYSEDPNTDKAFADFKTDTSNWLKLLFCIDMLNEGVHVEGVSGAILFRPTISPIIYKQQIGQALTDEDNTTPLILDVVNKAHWKNALKKLSES